MIVAVKSLVVDEMWKSCVIAGEALRNALSRVKAGMTTNELDRLVTEWIVQHKGQSSFKGYRGYPKHICVSVNEEVVHGVPGSRGLKEGDLVSVDLGVLWEGWYSDVAATVAIGKIPPASTRLLDT